VEHHFHETPVLQFKYGRTNLHESKLIPALIEAGMMLDV